MKPCLLLLSLLFSSQMYSADIFVSPNGNDAAPGSKEHPLHTIGRALRMAREWRRTNDRRTEGGITIRLESDATFLLDEPLYIRPEDSGTPDSKTTITSDGERQAVISGGMRLEPSSDGTYSASVAGRPLLARSLWIDGRKQTAACSFGEGEMQPMLGFDVRNRTIAIPSDVLAASGIRSISDAPQLEMVVHQRWAIAILRVKDIRIEGRTAVLSFHDPESRWEFDHPWPQPVINGERGSSSFLLRNARQFLDRDGEWWQNCSDGKVHLVRDASGAEVVAPRLGRLVTVEGSHGDRVHDVVFENVRFSYAAWERPARYGHVTLQGGFPIVDAYKLTENEGLPWARTLENQAWIARPEAAVSVSWAQRVDFVGCGFEHLSSTALDYVEGCSDISICRNSFRDIGGTAVLCGSFSEGAAEVHRPWGMNVDGSADAFKLGDAYTERFLIDSNTVSDATNEDWGCVGIGCGYVRDFTISNNRLSGLNYSGIAVGWGWTPSDTGMRNNVITGNVVSDYSRQLYDAGGIYTMSAQPNSLIQGNSVSAPHKAPYATNHRAFAIYFDACTDGFTVKGNSLGTADYAKEKYGYNTPGPNMKIEK